jgi:methionine-rich copper-binding protein CopC
MRRIGLRLLYAARFLVIEIACAGPCGYTPLANAHALVVRSQPSINAIVAPGEVPVALELNSRIDQVRSRLIARRPDGIDVVLALSVSSDETIITSRVLATMPGVWTLQWQVLARDGHITRGEIPFTVADPARRP